MTGVQVIVLAKRPVAGRVKTRLTPPFHPEEGAALAAAALDDTLTAVARARAVRRVLALGDPATDGRTGGVPRDRDPRGPGDGLADGRGAGVPCGGAPAGATGGWRVPAGVVVTGQCAGGLDARIAGAFADAYAARPLPTVLVGMDTPQVTPRMLEAAGRALADADAVLGPAADGGFWLLGLRRPDPALLLGVPMSTPDTGAAQLARLRAAGLRVAHAPVLRDVDTAADVAEVAATIPHSAFAAAYTAISAAGAARTGAAGATHVVARGVGA